MAALNEGLVIWQHQVIMAMIVAGFFGPATVGKRAARLKDIFNHIDDHRSQ